MTQPEGKEHMRLHYTLLDQLLITAVVLVYTGAFCWVSYHFGFEEGRREGQRRG